MLAKTTIGITGMGDDQTRKSALTIAMVTSFVTPFMAELGYEVPGALIGRG
jgi:hypothetical protein